MTNLLREFLANRTPSPERVAITNDAPVTRAEYNKLGEAVTNLTKVVEALVDDVQIATSPEKLTEAMNAAVKPLLANMGGVRGNFRAPLALPADRGYLALAPEGDDDIRANAKGFRPPLALKADNWAHLAPKGDD